MAVTVNRLRIEVRRDREIHRADGGWYQACWHFSFDDYHDPQNMGVGLLRVFNHDHLVPGAVWPLHPHRDIEGLTYVVSGEFEHADSLGNDGVLRAGGVQRMTLGSGAFHSERNHSQAEPMEFIQMWIMPDTAGLEPSVEQHQFTVEDRANVLLQAIRPVGSEGIGVTVHQDASVYLSRLDPGVEVSHSFREQRAGYLYLMDGAATLGSLSLNQGDAAKLLGPGTLQITASTITDLILVDVPLV
ncbi:MAG: pirin family protein [Armatimonadota bacterium]